MANRQVLELFKKPTGLAVVKACKSIMNQPPKPKKNTRTVLAPPPTVPSISPSIYGIELEEGLDVEWHWLEFPDGNKVVTNYRVLPVKS